nr:helix-turn-helix transcriptional regulator [uncultured Cohaesibacter sp.]
MINKFLTLMRENESMTIHEVASKLGVSSDSVLAYECGTIAPTPDIIEKYSEVFGVPVSSIQFFSKEDNNGVLSTKARLFLADKFVGMVEKLLASESRSA